MNLQQRQEAAMRALAAEKALAAVQQATTPDEMVLHIDDAIRQLTLISTQVEAAFPHQIDKLRAVQLGRIHV